MTSFNVINWNFNGDCIEHYEYECIIHGWPLQKNDYKLDIHEQVMMNLDVITKLMLEDIKNV